MQLRTDVRGGMWDNNLTSHRQSADGIRWIVTSDSRSVLPHCDRPHHVVDEAAQPGRVIVVDVLRFVGNLMVVLRVAERDVYDGYVLPDVVHLVAAAESAHRIGGNIPGAVDGHGFYAHGVDRIDDVAEFA